MKKILIITTYYPPDTTIASVRPYMFAKYLSKYGYDVTVLRSGELYEKADADFYSELAGVKVLSYLGEESPAERFKLGENICITSTSGKSRIAFMPVKIRKVLSKSYHYVFAAADFKKRFRYIQEKSEKQKAFLDSLYADGETFDIVFSTSGEEENIFAGEYASKLFKCKYILDFRDLFTRHYSWGLDFVSYNKAKRIQINGIMSADVVTVVSEGGKRELRSQCPEKKIITLYNGYDTQEKDEKTIKSEKHEKFSFCYTGALYNGLRDASPLFRALHDNCAEGLIDKNNIKFYYAGNEFLTLQEQAEKYGMESIIVNCGYLGRKEVLKLQNESDIFTVLSWNTKQSQGILTGKFYEGIRCEKPILSIMLGNEANSELKTMNEKYHYGFCYEEANRKNDYCLLKEWIVKQYENKMLGNECVSPANERFFTDFRYDYLARQLDDIIMNLTSEEATEYA